MKRNLGLCAAVSAATLFAASAWAGVSPVVQQKIASVQYLVGSWNCAHTVGAFAGTYTTTYAKPLGDLWLRQTYDFPAEQMAASEPPVRAEFIMGYDERRQAWVRFGVTSTGQYFAIRMTDTGENGW